MKNKFAVSVAIAAIIFFSIFVLSACMANYFNDYSKIIKANWGFTLPTRSHYTELYSKDSGASFHGDGIRYHVFSYEDSETIKKMLDWDKSEEETIYYSSYREAVTEWLNSINVPSKEFPNYRDSLYYYDSQEDNSEIILLWDASKGRIYIVESFL